MIDLEELGHIVSEVENVFIKKDLNELEIDLVLDQLRTMRAKAKEQQRVSDNLSKAIPGWAKFSKMLGKSEND